MKNQLKISLALLSLSLLSAPTHAAVVISVVGTQFFSTTMPGSPTDFFVANTSNWVPGGFGHESANVAGYADLTSFSLSGGIEGFNPTVYSTSITVPGGASPVSTGYISADTPYNGGKSLGVGLLGINSNPGFNYNDFNVYVMFSTQSNLTDGTISLDVPSSVNANSTAVADINVVNPGANFLEFNVKGLGKAYTADPSALPYLVLFTTSPATSPASYFSGISFQSVADVPEPSTWAMMAAGLVFLGALVRRKSTPGRI
jgi:hypothetical protein